MLPRVSCVMITARRRHFVARAVRCFQAQSYENRELVIFDNGEAPILEELHAFREHMGPGRRIRYYRKHFQGERSIGELRNSANDVTNGDYIAHWDDDEWFHPERLAYQMEHLGDAEIGGFYSCLWYDTISDPPAVWKFDAGKNALALGSSLIYKRSLWRHRQFASHEKGGEDNTFQEGLAVKVVPGLLKGKVGRCYMIAAMHETNSQRELHDVIRRAWEQDKGRISEVWERLDDAATLARVQEVLK